MSDNIRVAIRIRPLIPQEEEKKLSIQWGVQENNIYQIDENGKKIGDSFCFDHIFSKDKSNFEIYYNVVKGFVEPSLRGLNSTIFAYGQTSSGKTYTMFGDEFNMGIMSLAIDNIFDCIESTTDRKFLLRVSYIEIYNEKINDLLDTANHDIKIREITPGQTVLQNIKEELVSSKEQVYECLKCGADNKKMAATNINERSSRSHTIFRITIESTESGVESGSLQVSCLNLIDLAGSERAAQSKATGVRLKEGAHINKSLSSLGLVIRQLSDAQEFVSFRDSKLTRLLQDSLGGNSKTLIIATVTLTSVECTNSTLLFAQRAKAVKNKPKINEILTDATMNKRYAELNANLLDRLQHQLNINENLKQTTDANEKALLRLKEQMNMLKMFQSRQSLQMENNLKPNIRRHTFAYSGQINDEINDNKELRRPKSRKVSHVLSRIDENESVEDILHSSFLELKQYSESTVFEALNSNRDIDNTPIEMLRDRLQHLEQEHNELVDYTRKEEEFLALTNNKIIELQAALQSSNLKFKEMQTQCHLDQQLLAAHLKARFSVREKELTDEIKYLRETSVNKLEEPMEDEEVVSIKNQLCRLQELLQSNTVENQDEDTKKQLIMKFKSKIKIAKQMITDEISAQTNSFNDLLAKLNDPIIFPNELDSFNNLLNELTLVDNDISNNLDKEKDINELKVLVKIYESFLRKNQFIGRCSEKILSLQEQSKLNDSRLSDNILETEENHNESMLSALISEFTLNPEKLDTSDDISKDNFKLAVKSNEEFDELMSKYKEHMLKSSEELITAKNKENAMKDEIENLEENLKTAHLEISELQLNIGELSSKCQKLEKADVNYNNIISTMKQDIIRAEEETDAMRQQMQTIECDFEGNDDAISDNKTVNEPIINYKISFGILKRDLKDRESQIENLQDNLREKNEAIAEMTSTCKQLEHVILNKNKIIHSLRQQNGISEQEPECAILKNNLSMANSEITDLKSAIEKLTNENDDKILLLTNTVLERDTKLTEILSKCDFYEQEINSKDEIICNLKSEIILNEKTQNEVKIVIAELEKNNQNEVINCKQQLLEKDSIITNLTTNCGDLEDKCKILQKQIMLADEKISNIKYKADQSDLQYKQECENVKDLLTCKERELKSLEKLISEKDEIILKIEKDVDSARAEIRLLTNELANARLKTTEMETASSKDNLSNNIKNEASADLVKSLSQKISFLESRQGLYHKLFKESLKKNNDINKNLQLTRSQFEEKVKNMDIQMSCLMGSTQRKMTDITDSISNLEVTTNNLKDKFHRNQENYLLQLKLALHSIIEHLINEQKTILCRKHSPVERDYYKSVVKNLKSNNVNLKLHLRRFEHATVEDLASLKLLILETHDIFLQYHSLEKQFLAKQIDQLEQSNTNYVEEIISLKKKGNSFNIHETSECGECSLLKIALSDLRISTTNEITEKKSLQGEISNYKKTIGTLQKQLEDGQSKIVLLDFYIKENEELRKISKNMRNSQVNVETQCNLDEEKDWRTKYNLMKRLCENRKQKINDLKAQVALLEKSCS